MRGLTLSGGNEKSKGVMGLHAVEIPAVFTPGHKFSGLVFDSLGAPTPRNMPSTRKNGKFVGDSQG